MTSASDAAKLPLRPKDRRIALQEPRRIKSGRRRAGEPILAAGGIVLRRSETLRIAVVRLRKRNEWVLPKGKLDHGETARQAAEREVLEETGHAVQMHEFLGTLTYSSGAGGKVVHFWRMEAEAAPSRALMNDVKEVDWLPLEEALERLSRSHERAFLAEVGPLALQAADLAAIAEPSSFPDSRGSDSSGAERSSETDGAIRSPVAPLLQRLWGWLRGA